MIAAVIAALLVSATPPAAPNSPSATVSSFYVWYSKHGQGSAEPWSQPAGLVGAKPYLTDGFYRELTAVLAEQTRTHQAILDWDPFVDAQLTASKIQIGAASVRNGVAEVPVAIWYVHGAPPERIKAIVRQDGAWRIDDITVHDGHSLRAVLRVDLP
ncbi:MAG TPA: DUF3828 domain-containing protein [Candidatus Babeliales bacterium]|nr:DUF3828 domain-containing protein [Candidatus Babeliales bacterium]